jgi:Na+/H+-translocating membrane pyrophosphatase
MTLSRRLYLIGIVIFGGLLLWAFLAGFTLWIFPIIVGLFAVYLSGIFASRIMARKPKSQAMQEVSNDIHSAAKIYLRRQIRTILMVTPSWQPWSGHSWAGVKRSLSCWACALP